MSTRTDQDQSPVAGCEGQGLDSRYLGFFKCFNLGLYFEAHEVLEDLWLEDRLGRDGSFYKGLIQLAAAFVHLERNRPGPAAALFDRARTHLGKYASPHEHLDVSAVRALMADWRNRLAQSGFTGNPLKPDNAPRITLQL